MLKKFSKPSTKVQANFQIQMYVFECALGLTDCERHLANTNLKLLQDIKYFSFVPHDEMMEILSGSFLTVNSSESEVGI